MKVLVALSSLFVRWFLDDTCAWLAVYKTQITPRQQSPADSGQFLSRQTPAGVAMESAVGATLERASKPSWKAETEQIQVRN